MNLSNSKRLYIGLFSLIMLFTPGWACEKESSLAFPRPQCSESELQYGIACISQDLDAVLSYTRSPSYQEFFDRVVLRAREYLEAIAPAARKVVIVDLDDTLLNNHPYYQEQRGFDPSSWKRWIEGNRNGPYNAPVAELLRYAKSRGFSIMFITGRPPDQAEATLRQISGFAWDGLFFKPSSIKITSSEYKAKVRSLLRSSGYEVVLNLGDQLSDMDLPLSADEGDFLLPNILYTLP